MINKAVADIRWSTVGRSIDLRYPPNLAIALLTLATFAAGIWTMMMRGDSFVASAPHSLAWAGIVFLSWALAREVDPDRWYSAFFAAAGGFIAASIFSPPPLLMIFWVLIALRFINRSTGHPPGLLDIAAFCAVSVWLGWTTHWLIPLLALPALLLAGKRLRPALAQTLVTVAVAASGIALGMMRDWTLTPLDPAEGLLGARAIAVITLGCTLVIHSYRNVRSRADRTDELLQPHRVQWALTWAVSAGIVLTFGTEMSIQELSPLWAALAGIAFGWSFERLHTLVGRSSRG
ncbi:hypothetical protein KAH43_05255 [Candidatus Bipolaricaulota bacterium]|nr:hypothetical protein [Candidatus Bipolaricaulota bacterium]